MCSCRPLFFCPLTRDVAVGLAWGLSPVSWLSRGRLKIMVPVTFLLHLPNRRHAHHLPCVGECHAMPCHALSCWVAVCLCVSPSQCCQPPSGAPVWFVQTQALLFFCAVSLPSATPALFLPPTTQTYTEVAWVRNRKHTDERDRRCATTTTQNQHTSRTAPAWVGSWASLRTSAKPISLLLEIVHNHGSSYYRSGHFLVEETTQTSNGYTFSVTDAPYCYLLLVYHFANRPGGPYF